MQLLVLSKKKRFPIKCCINTRLSKTDIRNFIIQIFYYRGTIFFEFAHVHIIYNIRYTDKI